MFTGLVEAVGTIHDIQETKEGKIFSIQNNLNHIKKGDSIAVNGACQTVIEINNQLSYFKVYSSFKTLELTNLGLLNLNDIVNLERSIQLTSRLGGHLVQGHVDGTGRINYFETKDEGNTYIFHIEYPSWMDKYIIQKGSIAIDGISLTVVSFPDQNNLELVLIPETIEKTNAKNWKVGTIVNIELDLIAKYIEKLIVGYTKKN